MFPHERSLVKTYADRPFALIGVNGDPDLADAKAKSKERNVTWRSFWSGEKGPGGPIPTQWNIQGWPSIFLIDAEGIIRYKQVHGDELDKAIETLVKEAEAKSAKK